MSVDHVTPRAAGGSWAPTNLVCACLRCNGDKAARPLVPWVKERFGDDAPAVLARVWLALTEPIRFRPALPAHVGGL